MRYWLAVFLGGLVVAGGCSRHHYRLRADRQSYHILHEKSIEKPWSLPVRYSVQPDPRSRFYNPTNVDDPALPVPAPQLYAYEIPDLADSFAAPVDCEDGSGKKHQKLLVVKTNDPLPAVSAPPAARTQEQVTSDSVKVHTLQISTPPIVAINGQPINQSLSEIELVQAVVPSDQEEPEPTREDPFGEETPELRVVSIPESAWNSLPESCLFRMYEFESIRQEREDTFGAPPDESQRDQSKRLTLQDIVKLAQINNRDYQTQKELLYTVALRLTFERYEYQLKFAPLGNGTDVEYLHFASGGTSFEELSTPSDYALNKVLVTGGDFLARFANDVILTFNGPDGFAADVSSELLFNVTQPILQRDVVFENLTQAERNVVYAARDFARFRKQLFRNLALQYYNLLLSYRQIEIAAQNYFSNVRGFEQGIAEYRAGKQPLFQVDQFEQDVLSARNTLIVQCNSLEVSLDRLKLLIGLPTETPVNLNLSELEELTLGDEAQVALERVRRARRNLESEMRQSQPDQSVLLNGGIDLTRRMLRVMELRELLGVENPQRDELERLLAQLLVNESQLPVTYNRDILDEELRAKRPAPPIRIFERTLELIDPTLRMVRRKISWGKMAAVEPAWIEEIEQRLQLLSQKLEQTSDQLDEIVKQKQFERIPELVTQAESLLADAEKLSDATSQIVPMDDIRARQSLPGTIEEADRLLRASDDLLAEHGDTLSPVRIEMDDAMMTALLLRFDLMNQRGQLADAWRQIKLAADDLKSILNLSATHRLRTEKNRPFGFTLDESETRVNLSFDAPLNRRAQRNDYRRALIDYQASQRDMIEAEDTIKFAVRDDLRQLQLDQEQYVIAVASAALAYERIVSTRLQLQLGVDDVAARDVLEALRAYTASLSSVASANITYILDRTDLFLDIEELWVDDDGFWPGLYDDSIQPTPQYAFPEYALPVYGTLPPKLWYSKKVKRMLHVPDGQPGVHQSNEPAQVAGPEKQPAIEGAQPAENTP